MALTLITADTPSAAVGQVLKARREAVGYSVRDMALYTGWTEKQVRNWERGISPVKRAVLLAYASLGRPQPELDDLIRELSSMFDGTDPSGGASAVTDEFSFEDWVGCPRPIDSIQVLDLAS